MKNLELTQSPPQANRARDGGRGGGGRMEIERLGLDLRSIKKREVEE